MRDPTKQNAKKAANYLVDSRQLSIQARMTPGKDTTILYNAIYCDTAQQFKGVA
jgi:hypothetical protein